MSANKLKYWEVTTTKVIQANTKAEAVEAAKNIRRSPGSVLLGAHVDAERLPAGEAKYLVSGMS